MVIDQDKVNFVEDDALSPIVAKYLSLYIADMDWYPSLIELNEKLSKQYGGDEIYLKVMRNVIACTILMPATEHMQVDPQEPQRLMFAIAFHKFDELYHSRNWVEELRKVVKFDLEVEENRANCLALGFIHPLEYHPHCRQAFNWLYNKAEQTGAITPQNKEDISTRFTNVVRAYGGAVILNVFGRYEDRVRKIVNWRTGYFFERLINQVYQPGDIEKIKIAELDKASTELIRKPLIHS